MALDSQKTLTREERYKDFGHLAQKPNNDSWLMDDEGFLVMNLKYKMCLGQFQDIFRVLENVENANNPVYIELWDEAHYRQYLFQHGGTLTSVHKFRIRHRNPPPPGICPGGARPHCRLAESSVAVLRKWYTAHSKDPYPCRKAKHLLAEQAGIPVSKVNTWFSNARRKHKKELESLNKLDEANGTVNEKYKHKKGKKKTNPVHTLKSNGNAKFSEILDDRTLHPSYTVTSEMTTQSLILKTDRDYENVWNSSKCSFDKSVTVKSDNKQNGRNSDCSMPCQRLPFSEVYVGDNRQTEKTSSEGKLHFYNNLPHKNDQNQKRRNIQNLTCKHFLCSNGHDHKIQSLAVPDCKKQTVNKGSAIYNKGADETNARSVGGYRQLQQRLKLGKRHLETKIKDFKLVWKLRAKLKEKQKKGEKPEEKASNGVKTAVNCLKSLQKLCQHLENEVKSPVDYAYGVEFDGLDSEEGMAVEYNDTNGVESGINFAYDSTFDCKIENCTKSGPGIGEELIDWSGNILPHLSQHRPTWNDEAETFRNLLIGYKILGSPKQHSQRDQVVQSPLDVNNSHMFSAGEIQYYRSPSTDWESMWTSWCSQPSRDVMNEFQMDTSTFEDYHNFGNYSTVVGEAIQGLLNLSSSQESGSNSLQGQDSNTVSHCFK